MVFHSGYGFSPDAIGLVIASSDWIQKRNAVQNII